ncbi:MAG: hypothetical protein WBN41_02785 [Lysobacterales bacterium]
MTFIKHYLLAILVFNLAACSTLQEVSVENAMRNSKPPGVDYGSLVEVKTFDKQTAKFRVTVMNADGLGGSKEFFRYEDMASLKVEGPKTSGEDTWMIIGGILGAAALIWLIASADSVKVCSPSPCERP